MNRILINTLILLIAFSLLSLCACKQNIANMNKELKPTTSVKYKDNTKSPSSNEISKQTLTDSIKSFYSAIENQSSKDLASISDKEGIVFLRTFISGFGTRGQEVYETITPPEFPEDLTFSFVKGEAPIKLKTEFKIDKKDSLDIKAYDSDESLNWDNLIKPDILKTFGKLVGSEKEPSEKTRIYKLQGDIFCLAQLSDSGLQYSNWAVFEKKDKEFFLKIIALVY